MYVRKIVDALDIEGRTVVEIGPGSGAMTSWLLPRAVKLYCVEFDPRFYKLLIERYKDEKRVERIEAERRRQAEEKRLEEERRLAKEKEAARWHTWTSANGKFTIEAKFVKSAVGMITLEKRDGSSLQVPMEKLSEEDQKWIKNRGWLK